MPFRWITLRSMKFAQKNVFDLIVIGARGLGSGKELFLGSVSSYVIHKSKIPVLLVRWKINQEIMKIIWLTAINMKTLSNDIGLSECNNEKQFLKKEKKSE